MDDAVLSLNVADWVIVGVLILSGLFSLMRGLVREVLSLAGWFASIWLAMRFSILLDAPLAAYIPVPSARAGIAFVLLFVLSLIAMSFVTRAVIKLVKHSGLSGTDRTLGVLFGVARGGLIVALFIVMASLTRIPDDPWWQNSRLIPEIQPVVIRLQQLLPSSVTTYLSQETL